MRFTDYSGRGFHVYFLENTALPVMHKGGRPDQPGSAQKSAILKTGINTREQVFNTVSNGNEVYLKRKF
jgi:hypothetical protein